MTSSLQHCGRDGSTACRGCKPGSNTLVSPGAAERASVIGWLGRGIWVNGIRPWISRSIRAVPRAGWAIAAREKPPAKRGALSFSASPD